MTWRRLKDIVAAAILAADPGKAADDATEAAAGVGVFPDPESKDGYQGIFIRANAGDVQAFDAAIELIARALKTIGDTRPVQQRRASATGILADPRAAQDLIAEAERVRQAQSQAAAARRAGDMEAAEQIAATLPDGVAPDGRCGRQRPFTFGTAVLYFHLTRETLEAMLAGQPYAGAGVVRVEDIGPVILDQVQQWLGHANVVVKPVIDLAGDPTRRPLRDPTEDIGGDPADPVRRLLPVRHQHVTTSRLRTHRPVRPDEPRRPATTDRPLHHSQNGPATQLVSTSIRHRLKTHGGWTVRQLQTRRLAVPVTAQVLLPRRPTRHHPTRPIVSGLTLIGSIMSWVDCDGANSAKTSPMIEFGMRARKLPAPPGIVWDSLTNPHQAKARPWLVLLADEVEPTIIDAQKPEYVIWSSLWPSRPSDQIRLELSDAAGHTLVRFRLLTPVEAPDQSKTGHLRRRMNQLLFADLRFSYGQ